MLKQPVKIDEQKYIRLSAWKRLFLIAGLLLPGGSLTVLTTSQVAYANPSAPQIIYMCRAGDGGNGGVATNGSNGAGGAPGGDCLFQSAKSQGAPGGDHGSPGGNGGTAIFR